MLFVGVDGGGTRTTIALAGDDGRERVRREGTAGIVDPNHPSASAEATAALIRAAASESGLPLPADTLVAGLAGVGDEQMRHAAEMALLDSGIARSVRVVSDGETALEGAFAGGPGILLIAGTGSVAHARAADGRRAHCGGWGKELADEGSGFGISLAGLRAALQSLDGRGPPSALHPALLHAAGLTDPEQLPTWLARSPKAEVARLAPTVLRLAGSDPVAEEVVERQAHELALHVDALVRRLGDPALPVVFHGGVLRDPDYRLRVERAIGRLQPEASVRTPATDAVGGALRLAHQLACRAEPALRV